jgi:ABC-type antimicrobial peptide transport system permease subunit
VGKDSVDSFDVLVRSPRDAATVAERIDALFANASPQTRTAPLSVILQDILRQLGDIGFIAGALSIVVFLSMLVISSAAMISNTREGLSEYALFGALGYRRSDMLLIATLEPLLVGLFGGLLGIALAESLVSALQEPLHQVLEGFRLSADAAAALVMLSAALGLMTGIAPMVMVFRLKISDALKAV